MKAFIFILSLTITLISFSKGIEFEKMTLDQAKTKAKKENKIIFIDFYADWCGPCKWLAKNVFTENEVGDLFNENFVNLKINADHDNFIGREYNASSLPTLLWIDHEGNLKKKVVGAIDKQTLINHANYIIHPDTDPLALKKKEFDKGNREKEFLLDYAFLLANEEKSMDFLVEAYKKEYPTFDLSNSTDFTFFYLEDIKTNDQKLVANFLEDFKSFYKNEDLASMALEKLINLYVYKIEQAAEEKNETKRDQHIEELIKFVDKNNIKEIETDKIRDAFEAYYKEKTN